MSKEKTITAAAIFKNARSMLLVKSGRINLGKIEKVGKVFSWKGKRDSGVTTSIRSAKRLIEQDAGMSPRQYDIRVHRKKVRR